MKRRLLDVLTGVLIGAAVFGGSALAASGVTAVPSSQPIFVDGRQVQLCKTAGYSGADRLWR